MQKLSKQFVKELVYEALEYNRELQILKILDDDGEVLDTRENFPEEQIKGTYPGEKVTLTKESIDRIVRQEVKSFFEVK